MTPSKTYFVFGCAYTTAPEFEALAPTFTAPSNYGEEAATKFVKRKTAEWYASAAMQPYAGYVCEVFMASTSGHTLCLGAGVSDLGSRICSFISEAVSDIEGTKPVVVGFDPRTFVRSITASYAQNDPVPDPSDLCGKLWQEADSCLDVESLICPHGADIYIPAAIERLKLANGVRPKQGMSALNDCRLALSIASRYGIISANSAVNMHSGLSTAVEV